jgi:hypothetical protein
MEKRPGADALVRRCSFSWAPSAAKQNLQRGKVVLFGAFFSLLLLYSTRRSSKTKGIAHDARAS